MAGEKPTEIILGSGYVYATECTSSKEIPEDATFETDANLIGLIQGGATFVYTPPHISPLFNHQKQSKVTFAIRCTNQKHLYLYTSATYALFFNILPEKACFRLRIFVSLHRQSKEQPSCQKSVIYDDRGWS